MKKLSFSFRILVRLDSIELFDSLLSVKDWVDIKRMTVKEVLNICDILIQRNRKRRDFVSLVAFMLRMPNRNLEYDSDFIIPAKSYYHVAVKIKKAGSPLVLNFEVQNPARENRIQDRIRTGTNR